MLCPAPLPLLALGLALTPLSSKPSLRRQLVVRHLFTEKAGRRTLIGFGDWSNKDRAGVIKKSPTLTRRRRSSAWLSRRKGRRCLAVGHSYHSQAVFASRCDQHYMVLRRYTIEYKLGSPRACVCVTLKRQRHQKGISPCLC